MSNKTASAVVPKKYLAAFIMVTTLFPLWGFANDITNPMVAAFKKILLITNFESSLVQAAFYGGYCFMAIPAALFIKRFSYKSGILVGLALYSLAALFFPVAGMMMSFPAFLAAYFIMTCGLSFLETTSNPYILSMGAADTATRRLNLSQAFNPMGSLTGMFVAMIFILANLTSVSQDPELTPILAKKAHENIQTIVATKASDEKKWEKIGEEGLSSWVTKSKDVTKALKLKTPVQWDSVLAALQSDQKRITEVLTVIKNDNTNDSKKWALIQEKNLLGNLADNEKSKIETSINKGEEVNWERTPLLDGSPDEEKARTLLSTIDPKSWTGIQQADLDVLQKPYFAIGIVVALFFFIFLFTKLPTNHSEEDKSLNIGPTLGRLFSNSNYIGGVVAQSFYVGAQIMCWTFIIQYADNELGMRATTAQGYNILAMIIFVSSRFICTLLLKYISPGSLLATLAVGGTALTLGVIFIQGMAGLYCLVGISACMSLMFPTIYGIALEGLGDDAKLGAAGLIMAIGGGCLMPPLQASIMDKEAFEFGSMVLSSTRVSFALPLICFIAIAIYGFLAHKKNQAKAA